MIKTAHKIWSDIVFPNLNWAAECHMQLLSGQTAMQQKWMLNANDNRLIRF